MSFIMQEASAAEESLSFDIGALLQPLSQGEPCGVDLRVNASASGLYHSLRDARTSARNNERAALAEGEPGFIRASDWQSILDTVPRVLLEQSKDLELVAWLIEALVRSHGFDGLRAGYALARQLIERFGAELHPRPDEEGKSTQLSALIGLNGYGGEGALISPIKAIALTQGNSPAPFSAWQCEQAFELERIEDAARREQRSKRGFVTQAELDQAISETSIEFLLSTQASLRAALAEYERFQQALDEYCGSDTQPSARIHDILSGCLQSLTYIAGERLIVTEPAVSVAEAGEPTSSEPGPAAALDDREQALRKLREVAEFFRRSEPHSPVSYAIEQAVRWSGLSLPELLAELIPDDGARQRFQQLTGIRN